jgi:archaellum component FlaG (FlaF/FlaG flagellin family)
MAVNPQPGTNSVVTVGGTAVEAVPASPQGGGIITNPTTNTDQAIAGTAEPLYVCAIGPATLQANGTTFALAPGQSWNVIPGQMSNTTVNAATGGHKFSVIWW